MNIRSDIVPRILKWGLGITGLLWLNGVLAAPGFLLLIGGGGEKFTETSWEREPYQWAVDQSLNKRVAIISFYEQTRALPDFFEDELGAAVARNFLINNDATANAQATYDSLINYDVIFLKGGDQYNYYSHYRGTRTEEAILQVYREGGVVCGTSAGLAVLGGVDYVAAEGSADPMEALVDPMNPDITLENDFLPFLPGILLDSHVAERGRFGRLIAFMAHWQWTRQESLTGIGLDDMTAMAIDTSLHATVYGTGAANLYRAAHTGTFSQVEGALAADSVRVTQLLHHCSIDLRSGEITGLPSGDPVGSGGETLQSTLLLSGGDALEENEAMLHDLLHETGNPGDPILILTRSIPDQALLFRDHLMEMGNQEVDVASATLSSATDTGLETRILHSPKILFVDLNIPELKAFLKSGPAGSALEQKMAGHEVALAFVGGVSRLAGKVMVDDYLVEGSSYYGNMEFQEGLGLLTTSMVMPHTFLSSAIYENTATAVPYAMVTGRLTYGIWLSPGNYLKVAPEEGIPGFRASGSPPVMILKNSAGFVDVSSQTSYGDGNDLPRQVAGFDEMWLSVLDPAKSYPAGDLEQGTSTGPGQRDPLPFSCYPNPVNDHLYVNLPQQMTPSILNLHGQLLWRGSRQEGTVSIPVRHLQDGTYILALIPAGNGDPQRATFTIIKQ